MPKGDSLCPLGFHPQFRRPNYCKRCFREYNEHKQSGSNTSINSLSLDRDSKKDENGVNRSRSDLTTASYSKSNYEDEDDKKGYSRGSYTRSRPMSWSAQDLRKAVDDAKEQVKSSKGDVAKIFHYGGNRSITQDLGVLSKLTEVKEINTISKVYSKEAENEPKSSFSSYLAAKHKMGLRPTVSKSPSLSSDSVSESSKYRSDGRPPKAPVRSKTELDFRDPVETVTISRPKKSIQCLRDLDEEHEVKSEDADATYVIQLTPKKGTSPEKDSPASGEVERMKKESVSQKKEIKKLTDTILQLENHNKELLNKKPKFGEFRISSDASKYQQKIDELNEDIKSKNKEVKNMRKELDKRPISKDIEKILEELRSKLHSSEQLCEEYMEELDENKKEIATLENEIEELQDNFREDQADEYRDLKRDLEQKAKDCRVLQFKLKKAERRTDQLENDKDEVEAKLKDLQVGETDLERAERIKLLEKEVGLAKEVSLKMHEEMEKMKSQLEAAETDRRKLKEKVQETPMRPSGKFNRSNMLGRQGSQETPEQTQRDLQDSLEREQDIKEQLKYSEEETRNLRKKLSRIEDENETLQGQLSKMSIKAKRQRSMERTGSSERSNSVERGTLSRQGSSEKQPTVHLQVPTDELDPTDLKIQLELNEQEVVILRRKVESLESDNLRLQKELKDFLSNIEAKKTQIIPASEPTKSSFQLNRKIRTLEQELEVQLKRISDIEKERDQLQTDLSTARKRAKITRNRSLEQTEAEEKKRTEPFEKEITALRQKCIEFESTNEKLQEEVKNLQSKPTKKSTFSVQDNLGLENQLLSEKIKALEKKLKDSESQKLKSAVEKEIVTNNIDHGSKVKELQDTIESLRNELSSLKNDNDEMKCSTAYKDRKVKTPKDTTPKLTLIKWVNELENECAALYATLQLTDKKEGTKKNNDSTGQRDILDKLQKEKERNDELSRQLQEERKKNPMKAKSSTATVDDERFKKMQRELETEKLRLTELQSQISEGTLINFEQLRQAQTEKHKVQKELSSSQQNAVTFEKKLKETEETLRISEKAERNLRNLLEKAEQRLDDERNAQYTLEERQKEMSSSWLKERDDLKREILEYKRSKESLEKEMKQVQKTVKSTEERLIAERKATDDSEGKLKSDKERYRKLQTDKEKLQVEYNDLKEIICVAEKEKEKLTNKHSKDLDHQKKENEDLKIRMTTLEIETKTERKKRERLEKESSIGLTGKNTEIQEYRDRLQKIENDKVNILAEMETMKMESTCQINDLYKQLKEKNKALRDMKNSMAILEDDLQNQKYQISSSQDQTFSELKNDYETIEGELKTLRDTYNLHKDTWIKEKLNMQVQMIEMEDRYGKNTDGSSYSDKKRLMSIIDDKHQQIETSKLELATITDQLSYYKKDADDTRKKIEDLEKLQDIADKRQSSAASDNRGYESTIHDLKTRLTILEKTSRSEITKMKMRYDTKIKALTEEVSTLTHHMNKYRRERDTFKEMLNGAQKTIAELKGNSTTSYRTSRADNATEVEAVAKRLADHEAKTHLNEILDLQGQITELEDKLADSRMEVTKLKNEAIDQRTTFEIQLCEMQTKLNEFEEDRLLSGSGRKVAGLRTRLELNWQREREEQQRLIQETSILAKDLRQTLYEVERARDMERLDAKRKIDQLKKTVSMEHQDTKGKVQELQTDIRDLREAHAKLRQINEKLRKDKDRTSLEREAMRDKFLGSSREHLNQQAKMEKLLEHVYRVKDLSPLVIGESIDESSSSLKNLAVDSNPKTKEQFTSALKGLARHSEDLKNLMGLGEERDRMRRTPSFRKALSVESDDGGSYRGGGHNSRVTTNRGTPRGIPKSQLYRKAQSLDHQLADEKGKIWVEAGSTSSIESARTEDMKRSGYDFDGSLDRMSTGSQTSDLDLTAERKKGIRGMLSKFGKAKSIEDTHIAGSIVGVGVKALVPGISGSGSNLGNEEQDHKMKDKIKTFFKKSPSSRSQSSERDNQNSKRLSNQYDESTAPSVTIDRPPRSLRR